jgi:hypothetical protein
MRAVREAWPAALCRANELAGSALDLDSRQKCPAGSGAGRRACKTESFVMRAACSETQLVTSRASAEAQRDLCNPRISE